MPNHHALLKLALGQDPEFDQGQGPYRIAAKYYHRRFSDGLVRRVPTDDEIKALEADIPGVSIYPLPREGQQLSELAAQDSYSFEVTDIIVGADSVAELEDKYERIVQALHYDIEDTKHTDQAEPR